MPLYEYFCLECKEKFELLRPMSRASEPASCPRCHREVGRALSRFAPMSKDASGASTLLGSSSCATCSATSCESCGR